VHFETKMDALDKGESLQKIAKDLGVGSSTFKDWKKKIERTFSHFTELEYRRTLKKPKLHV
jgi:transposase